MRAIQKLIDKIYALHRFKNGNSTDRLPRGVVHLLQSYFRANRTIHKLRNEISVCNRFWSRYLTVIYCTLTVVFSYFTYMLLVISGTKSAFEMTYFVFFAVLLFAMLFAITYECSVLVYLNCGLLKMQRKFRVHLRIIYPVKMMVLLKVNLSIQGCPKSYQNSIFFSAVR